MYNLIRNGDKKMTKVIVDQNKCVGCGMCVSMCEENFAFNDKGLSTVINDKVTEKTKGAAKACPVDAICIIESENNSCECECGECDCDDDDECNCSHCECHENHE